MEGADSIPELCEEVASVELRDGGGGFRGDVNPTPILPEADFPRVYPSREEDGADVAAPTGQEMDTTRRVPDVESRDDGRTGIWRWPPRWQLRDWSANPDLRQACTERCGACALAP